MTLGIGVLGASRIAESAIVGPAAELFANPYFPERDAADLLVNLGSDAPDFYAGYARVAESRRSNAYQAASNGVANSSGPQMPICPRPSTPR